MQGRYGCFGEMLRRSAQIWGRGSQLVHDSRAQDASIALRPNDPAHVILKPVPTCSGGSEGF